SSGDGYRSVLSGNLRINRGAQTFAFKPEERPTGRWIRLTILSNYGNDYVALSGVHAYGRPVTQAAYLPDVTGTYDGASGWGKVQLTQDGDQVTGCYAYQGGTINGVIVGRVMKLDMVEADTSGDDVAMTGLFSLSGDGRNLIGIARNNESYAQNSPASYYSAKRINNRPANCG
ncbi:MAG: hypothetical protein WBQ60_11485, partial [Asticcacaulis sp.]